MSRVARLLSLCSHLFSLCFRPASWYCPSKWNFAFGFLHILVLGAIDYLAFAVLSLIIIPSLRNAMPDAPGYDGKPPAQPSKSKPHR